MTPRRIFSAVLWLFFLVWLILEVNFSVVQSEGIGFIDFKSYVRAVDRLKSVGTPYLSPSQSREIWRSYHRDETKLLDAYAADKAQEALAEYRAQPPLPGPYLYPPTLALLIDQLHISPLVFAGLLVLSVVEFSWLWLRTTAAPSSVLLLVIFSWDVHASFGGGNVELLLLFAMLLSAWLLWKNRGLLATPLIAFVLLVKPFYLMFFLVFVLMLLSNAWRAPQVHRHSLALGTLVILALVACEVFRWGPHLRGEALNYLMHAFDYLWFVLPPADQTPLSAWNRTPLQALISAGLPLFIAKVSSLGLWLVFVVVTLWQTRAARLSFPLTFALAFILLYWGRPVGWGLNYLEVIVVATALPGLNRWQKPLLVSLVAALMFSHWWAFVLTARGNGMPLLTLQSAEFPWETWLVLPLSWLLLLYVTTKHKNVIPPGSLGLLQ